MALRMVSETELSSKSGELAQNPSEWMPWNYQTALEPAGASLDSD